MTKRLSLALALLLLLLLLSSPALAFVEPSGAFYVTDKADVLTTKTEDKIVKQNELLCEETGGQIVVVTMPYLDEDGFHTDEYAVQLMNDWGVGDREKNNGMLLLVVTEAGKAWLTTGDGINEALTNDKVESLLKRWFWKKFDEGDYNGAVSDLFDQLIAWYEDYYGFRLGSSSQNAEAVQTEEEKEGGMSPLLVVILIVVILYSIFRSGFFGIFTPRRRTWGFGPRSGSGYSSPYRGSSYTRSSGGSYRSSGGWSGGSRSSGGSRGGGFSSGGHSGGGGRSGGGGAGRR